MIPLQKYLGWVQRNFYQVSQGELPFPVLTQSIDHDWPQRPLVQEFAFNSAAGNVTTTIYAPALGRHGLVINAHVIRSGADIVATDIVNLIWSNNPTTGVGAITLAQVNLAIARQVAPLIGCFSVQGAVPVQLTGLPPVYVPSGYQLQVVHTSTAGGVALLARIMVIDLPDFQPLRLP